MNINTRDLSFLNFNETEMQWLKYNNLLIWEAWKKLTASGLFPLTLTKSKGADLVDYKLYGESVQESKNLFNKNSSSSHTAQCTVEAYNNGIKVVSNTTATSTSLNVYYDLGNYSDYVGKTLTFTLENTSNTDDRSIVIYFVKNSANFSNNKMIAGETAYIGNKGSVTATIEADDTVTNLGIRILIGSNAVGCEFVIDNIQVEVGTTATGYEPYVEPTPETPIEIESVGDKTKNLARPNERALTNLGLTITPNENGTFTISGVAEKTGNIVLSVCNTKKDASYFTDFIRPVGVKVSSYCKNVETDEILSLGTQWVGVNTGNNYWGDNPTYTEPIMLRRLYFQKDINVGENPYAGTYKLQMEWGTTKTEYEPYGYKIPVKVSGKNLYDVNSYPLTHGIWINARTGATVGGDTSFAATVDYVPCTYLQNKTITISHTKGASPGIAFYDTNKAFISGAINNNGTKITTTVPDTAIYLRFSIDVNYSEVAMIELGETPTDHEPFVEPVTTNIYLDEPLRKIGDYEDYIDFKTGKVYRNIKHLDFIGNEKWEIEMDGVEKKYPTIVYRNLTPSLSRGTHSNCYSNRFIGVRRNGIYSGGLQGVCTQNSYVRIHYPDLTNDLDKFKEFLSTNETYIEYILATPTEETIELPNIPTHKGTTILSVDTTIQPSNAEVIYLGKP